MGLMRICDNCSQTIYEDTHLYGNLHIFNFNDGYNTENYNVEIDLCGNCLNKIVQNLEFDIKGRV